MIKHLLGWLERRRRVSEELRFHANLLEEEFIALGCDRIAARELAIRRLGSVRKHRQRAYKELGATVRDLMAGFAEERTGPGWLTLIALALLCLLLQALILPDVVMVVSYAIWAVALLCLLPAEALRWAQNMGHWRYHVYSVLSLIATALVGNIMWTCLMIFWRLPLWPTQGWSLSIFSVEIIAYLLGCCALFRVWASNRTERCRRCACKLRLPDQRGRFDSLLIEAKARSTVCIHGHGTLIADYWRNDWRAYGAFWDEIFKPRGA